MVGDLIKYFNKKFITKKLSSTHVATIIVYLNNCCLPRKGLEVNTTYLFNAKPHTKPAITATAFAALIGVTV
jgi:hypothetical protein